MEERQIKINLDFKATTEFVCSLTTSVVNFLLHFRNIIPFTFENFEKSIKKIQTEEISCFKRLKTVDQAKETYERICDIKELIQNEITSTTSILLVFGKSIYTALEAYEIILPLIPYDNTLSTFINESSLRRVLLQLITHDYLQHTYQMPTTNVFFLFNRPIQIDNDDLVELRDFELNKSCKKFSIEFYDTTTSFEVFQDAFEELLTIKDEKDIESSAIFEEEIQHPREFNWYQSKIFIKGFNDTLVNNKSIWN